MFMSGILFKSLQDSLKSLNSTNHNHNAILNNCANLKKNKVSKIILEMFYFFVQNTSVLSDLTLRPPCLQITYFEDIRKWQDRQKTKIW